MSVESRIGLALGGGGARGMVHILVCEVFDELGIKPAADRRNVDRGDHRRRLCRRLFRPRDARGRRRLLRQAPRRAGAALEGAAARLHRSPARPLADAAIRRAHHPRILRARLRAPAGDLRGAANPAEGHRLRLLCLDRSDPDGRAASPGDRRLGRHPGALPAGQPRRTRPDRRRRLQSAPLRPRRGVRDHRRLRRRGRAERGARPAARPARMHRRRGADLDAVGDPREAEMAPAGRAGPARHQRRLHHGFPEDAGDPRDERRLQGRSEAPPRSHHQHAVRASDALSAGRGRSGAEASAAAVSPIPE